MSVEVLTFGCRLNSAEFGGDPPRGGGGGRRRHRRLQHLRGDVEAVRQARQAMPQAARERPGARLVVTGCAAQTDPQAFAAMPEVDRVLGNEEKLSAARHGRVATRADRRRRHHDRNAGRAAQARTAWRAHRAFVQVQNGCDHRCTFCIIPFGRGNSRSVPIEEVIAQVRRSGRATAMPRWC